MFTVYVLRSQKNGYRYIGQTNNFNRRLFEHQNRLSKSTKHLAPFIVEYTEIFDNRSAAMKREHFLKSGKGREWLDNIKQ